MRVAVVGAGLFGITAAIHLVRAGHKVEVFDKANDWLMSASGVNQFRLHAGYHYPRSQATARECQQGMASFRQEYGPAIIDRGRQFYAIAREGSKVTASQYIEFCLSLGLPFQRHCEFIDPHSVEVVLSVREGRIDIGALNALLYKKRELCDVKWHWNTEASADLRRRFDKIVIAAYAGTNDVASELDCPVTPFQFEVCEKPVVRMPDAYRDVSIVIMDGEFCSLDPYGDTGLHVMGHVKHAIHATNTGYTPHVPYRLQRYLNRGVIENPEGTRFTRFVNAGSKFIPALTSAEYVGSMFTVRAVLPHRDHDDARPTLVEQIDEQCLRIFSGKLGCAVTAAQSVVQMLTTSHDRRDAPAELVA